MGEPHLVWVTAQDPPYDGMVALVQAVAATGGAVGWLEVPPAQEVRDWLDGVLADGTRTVVALDEDGTVLGSGCWSRLTYPVLVHNAEIRKVMVHPDTRGRRIGEAVTRALVEDARAAGVEVLTLDCRGNNHGALRLYARLGFVTTGRRPDYIAVGRERFDQVLLHLDLRSGAGGLQRHGGLGEGPGSTGRPSATGAVRP